MACPSAVVAKGRWPDGLSHQEAAQAHGEEEAPQTAEEDADPAQEQEVAVLCGNCGCRGRVGGVPAVPVSPARRRSARCAGPPVKPGVRATADHSSTIRMSVTRWPKWPT